MKKLSRCTIALFACFWIVSCPAQNLVQDSSFEAVTSHYCGIVTSSAQFNSLFLNWESPTAVNGDQYSLQVDTSCINHCTNPQPQGPIPPKGIQAPRTGDVFAGIFLYTIPNLNQREYLQTELSAPLTIGELYEVSAWVSLADFSEFATPALDFLLTTQPVGSGSGGPLPYVPQTSHTTLLANTTDWMLVRDTLLANSAWQYLTIGNFKDDASTVTVPNPGSGGGPGQYGCYYFVEDVSVRRVSNAVSSTPALAEPQAILPEVWQKSFSGPFKARLPEGGSPRSFSVYDLGGRIVYSGMGPGTAWQVQSASPGIYVWILEWVDGVGQVRVQRGKVMVVEDGN